MPRVHRTEEETRRRVADAVVAYIADNGIGVVPDLPMERILASADVSRASAYRIWPGRGAFTAFALEEAAAGNAIETLDAATALRLADDAVAAQGDRLDAAAAFVAASAAHELAVLLRSPRWRAFVGFQAVATATGDEPLRAALARADAQDAARLGAFYSVVGGAWGLRVQEGAGIAVLADAARQLARGAVARILAGGDEVAATRGHADALAALVRGTFVADPEGVFDRDRLEQGLTGG